MSVAFWSEEVVSGKEVEVQPPEGYVLNVCQIALQTKHSSGKSGYGLYASTYAITGTPLKTLVATLRPQTCENVQVSLVFGFDVPVKFMVECGEDKKASVFISGYYQPGPDSGDDDDSEADYDDYMDDPSNLDDENLEVYKQMLKSGGSELDGDDDEEEEKGEGSSDDDDDDSDGSGDSDDSDDSEDEEVDEAFISKMIQKTGGGYGKHLQVEELGNNDDDSDKNLKKIHSASHYDKKAKEDVNSSGKKMKGSSGKPISKPVQKSSTPGSGKKHGGKSGDKRKR